MMTKQTLLSIALLLLLTSVPNAMGQEEQGNNTDTSTNTSNCLCEGRGELRSDYVVDWLPEVQSLSDNLDNIAPDLSTNVKNNPHSCGDIQSLLSDRNVCPEASWLSFCCTDGPPFYKCATQVRTQILGNNYDKLSIPSTSLVHDPVNVTVQMVYHTVTEVNEAKGVVEIFVHLILKWKDSRLAWDYDSSSVGPCTALPVNARAEMQQGLKDSEIWVPEFDLLNQVSGVKGMSGNLATIESDGSVAWFRQGSLKAICQMENLGQIPFETLGCQLIMGSNSLGVNYQLGPSGGIRVSDFAGPYNGYRLIRADPGLRENDNIVFFDLEFSRGTSFYIQNIIVPVTIFSFCSILTMAVAVGAFQTLALNFTLLLTSTTQKVATARLLPVTNESLWLVDYVSGSFYFIVFTLVETFAKFIILKMREERKRDDTTDEEDGRPKSTLPPWFFTFSLRKMDVICCCLSFLIYCIYIIVFFTYQAEWGSGVQFNLMTNQTNSEL